MSSEDGTGTAPHLRAVSSSMVPASHDHTDSAAALAALVERTARGDEEAFSALHDLVAGAVFGLALRIVRDRDLARDVAQEALVEVWRQAARFDTKSGTARSWILTITHRRAVDRVRSEQAHTDRLYAHGVATPVDHGDQDEVIDRMHGEWQAARVRSGLTALTERQREALELTYFKGFTHREAAAALDIPLGTAKARIRDGLIKLRDALGVDQ